MNQVQFIKFIVEVRKGALIDLCEYRSIFEKDEVIKIVDAIISDIEKISE